MAAAGFGAAVAAVVGFAGSALVAWCGPIDPPGRRTSHHAATPTSGGLAILAGTCAGLFATLATLGIAPVAIHHLLVLLGLSAALALLGAVDDLYDLPAPPKLAAMTAAGALLILATTPALRLLGSPASMAGLAGLAALAVGGAWLLLATNAVNFMDGADGLVAGSLALAFAALALAAAGGGRDDVAACALAACAAYAGLLPWNLGGRLFQGDAGALSGGFLFAGLCLLAADAVGPAFGVIALLPLLLDVLHTLLRRARAGSPLMQAHREHLYQRWLAATGRSHAALAWRTWSLVAACCALALATARLSWLAQWEAALAAAAALSAGWIWLSGRVDARVSKSNGEAPT